uniref:Uncharacterized protein n=1 Tax=Cacopsylla melanoneura TaxID=428564 RepID=A0A8D9BZ81_9HEMI
MKNCFINNILFIYRERYPERRTPHHSFFSKSIKDCLTGHLNFHTERARERPVRNENFEERVLHAVENNSGISTRQQGAVQRVTIQQFGRYSMKTSCMPTIFNEYKRVYFKT